MSSRAARFLAGICLALMLSACGAEAPQETPAAENAMPAPADASETPVPTLTDTPETPVPTPTETEELPEEEENAMLSMMIGETPVAVDWEDNESVDALRELCRAEPLQISLSMYGGFEQVGPIGASLPRSDVQTTTAAGDIVLYAGNQIVVFFGSNAWAYTCLGHITDQSAADMEALLGHGDVTLSLRLEAEG